MSDLVFFFGAFAVGIAALGWVATGIANHRHREREGLRRMSTLDIEDALRLRESRERLGRLGQRSDRSRS